MTVYAGTKGYIDVHSKCLATELKGRDKDVLVHSVGVGKVSSNAVHAEVGFAVLFEHHRQRSANRVGTPYPAPAPASTTTTMRGEEEDGIGPALQVIVLVSDLFFIVRSCLSHPSAHCSRPGADTIPALVAT